MRVLVSLLWASTALQAYTVIAQAFLYTSEAVSLLLKAGPPSISLNTVRLLLAQRLGLSEYYSLENADESALEVLNTFNGEQRYIFDYEEAAWGAEKLLFIVDGVSNPKGDILYGRILLENQY